MQLPNWIPIDMETGEYNTEQDYDSYRLHYDEALKQMVVEWTVNTSVLGWRSLHYTPTIPLNLSNVGNIILSIKSNLVGRNILLKLSSERPWENFIGWRYYITSDCWNFLEFNMTQSKGILNEGNFNPTSVKIITLGFTVKPNDPKNIQIYYSIMRTARARALTYLMLTT